MPEFPAQIPRRTLTPSVLAEHTQQWMVYLGSRGPFLLAENESHHGPHIWGGCRLQGPCLLGRCLCTSEQNDCHLTR